MISPVLVKSPTATEWSFDMKKEYLECGRIVSAHGVRGLVKVESWCDSTKVLASRKRVFTKSGEEYIEHTVESASAGEYVIMNIGFPSREEAQAAKNTVLYLKRCDIPLKRGDILLADMIDLPVIDADTGRIYGTCTEISDGVQNRLYTVKTEGGDVLIPARPEFIKRVDVESGIYIKPIPGFFEE